MPVESAPLPDTAPPEAPRPDLVLDLPDPAATDRLGAALAARLRPGDTLLLSGAVGAGKSHLARALILAALARAGRPREDVPSPTYTLVQSYDLAGATLLHADLYRLSGPDDAIELGLLDAFGAALCLVEWPDRLGNLAPADALHLDLAPQGDGRRARLYWTGDGANAWADRLAGLDPAARP